VGEGVWQEAGMREKVGGEARLVAGGGCRVCAAGGKVWWAER